MHPGGYCPVRPTLKREDAGEVLFFGLFMKSYSEKLLDPRWQKLRLDVFSRDKFTCRICGDKSSTLNAHHVHYHPLADGPWDYEIESLITLCQSCHSAEHEGLSAAKSSVMLALIKLGYTTTSQFDCLAVVLESITKEDIENLFLERNCAGKKSSGDSA